ncbi:hypothetical protein I4U23_031442 [Adineta vaga]|nr:hypothetical protein I4U23_031442 [Adineta vaga]
MYLVAQSVLGDMRSFTLSLMEGSRFQCAGTTCPPFATFSTLNIRLCQTSCLNSIQCKAITFHQSTSRCDLFNEILNSNGTMLVDINTVTLIVITGTRIPAELTTTSTTTSTTSSSSTSTTTTG